MNIACLAATRSFHHRQIGGTDAFFRRIARKLAGSGHRVTFMYYPAAEPRRATQPTGIDVCYYESFEQMLRALDNFDGSVLINAIRASDRLQWIHFRHRHRKRLRFFMVYSLFPDTAYGRLRHFLETRLYPCNGGCICISGRIANYLGERRRRARALLPPVPHEYFRRPTEKSVTGSIVVAYIGRLELGKGAMEAIDILEHLCRREGIDARVHAYAFDGDESAEPLRERLSKNNRITCHETVHQGWSPHVEQQMAEVLRDIDVLLLPYRRVSSSIDTPLLLLEGMASLCCCITRGGGDIPEVYGESPFLIAGRGHDEFVAEACDVITGGGRSMIAKERERLVQRRNALKFDVSTTADRLIRILEEPQ